MNKWACAAVMQILLFFKSISGDEAKPNFADRQVSQGCSISEPMDLQ